MLASVRRQLLEEQQKVQQLQQAGAAMRLQFEATLRAHEDKHASALHALAIEIDRLRGARSSRVAELEVQLGEAQRTVERERDEMRRLTETLQDELTENHCQLTSLVRESAVRADVAEAISAQLQRRVEEQAEQIESLSARLRGLPAAQNEPRSHSEEPANATRRPSIGATQGAHVHEPLARPSAAEVGGTAEPEPEGSIEALHAQAGTRPVLLPSDRATLRVSLPRSLSTRPVAPPRILGPC
jgi:uncharacterized coiled-coil protein SlyX